MGNALKIKMGVDASGVKKGTQEAKGHLNSFQKTAKTVSTAVKAAWAVVGVAIVKVVKDMINLTQQWGDRFQAEMKGMKSAYQSLVRNIGSGKGWKELIQNMRDAYTEGKKIAEMLDDLFEQNISADLNIGIRENEIAKLQTVMKDRSRSDSEREAAAKRILQLEQEIKAIKQQTAQAAYDAAYAELRLATDLTEEEARNFLLNYNDNKQLMEDAKELKRLREEAAKAARAEYNGQNNWIGQQSRQQKKISTYNALRSFESGRSDIADLETMIAIMDKYGKSSDEIIQNFRDAWMGVITVEKEVTDESRSAELQLGKLEVAADRTAAKANKVLTPEEQWAKYLSDVKTAASEYASGMSEVVAADEEMAEIAAQLLDEFEALHPAIDKVNEDLVETANGTIAATEQFMQMRDQMAEIGENLYRTMVTSIGDSISYLAEAFGSGEFNIGTFAKTLLGPLADACVSAGLMIMTSGEAVEAFKKSFESLQGAAAIAAGAALIAVGAATKAGLAALAGSSSYSSSRSMTGSSYSAQGGNFTEQSINVSVTGTLVASGSQLVAVINNETNRKNHTT